MTPRGDALPAFQRHSATSREAALSMYEAVPGQRGRVLRGIATYGPVSDESLAALLRMNPSSLRPRRIELQGDGLIVRHPVDGRTSTGRRCARWVLRELLDEDEP